MRKLSLFLFTAAFFFITLTSQVEAVTKTAGDLEVTFKEPLFPKAIIWYPGLSVAKNMTVKNLGSERQRLYFKANNTAQTGNLAQVLFFSVSQDSLSLYGDTKSKTLKNFWDEGEVSLLELAGGNSVDLTVSLSMDTIAGNEYQGEKAEFDLTIGFKGKEETVTVTAVSASGGGVQDAVLGKDVIAAITATVTQPATGFLPGVLGVATPSGELTEALPTGEIAGEVTEITPYAPQGKLTSWGVVFALVVAGGILSIILFYLKNLFR